MFATLPIKKGFDTYHLHMPKRVQRAILRLPEVERWRVAYRREAVCIALARMGAVGISQNRVAQAFGVPSSSLSVWRRAYERDGIRGLLPKLGRFPQNEVATIAIT